MFTSDLSRSGTSVVLALSLTLGTAAPLFVMDSPAVAQRFPDSLQRERVRAGTIIPVIYQEAEKIVLTPDEIVEVTIEVAEDQLTSNGRVWLPRGSKITGELRPVSGGTQFIADEVMISPGRQFRLDADSEVITRTETVTRGASARDILTGAAAGAAAATAIAAVTGDKAIATEEVLGGAGVGAIAGVFLGRDKVDVVVVRPEEDLDLRLQSDIVFR